MGFKFHPEMPQGSFWGAYKDAYSWGTQDKQPWATAEAAASFPARWGQAVIRPEEAARICLEELGLEPRYDSCYILQKKQKALPNRAGERRLRSTLHLAVEAEAVPSARVETKPPAAPARGAQGSAAAVGARGCSAHLYL